VGWLAEVCKCAVCAVGFPFSFVGGRKKQNKFTQICTKLSTMNFLFYTSIQRMAVWLVADFEVLSYQVTTTFDTSCAARIPTAPAINYTACWQLVIIHIRLFVIYLALNFLSLSNCTNLSTKHKFILFF